ncbi:hypothetical protein [Haloplasma contractile]|uniref:Uncharacterized protein n=1 Tax=Haloplasma contractile SSD-17B TaxID=1033810 RepID=U2FRJ5_9MOLU|nr:hypothetical protein [Haloplasma contractile]ERJ13584.1 hypothetical protein HLPCO_000250 [Haloplasma contractile SSD-17B]
MKRKIILFVLVGLLGSGMYVGATTLLPDQMDPVIDSNYQSGQTRWNTMYHGGNGGHMSLDYYLSQEDHLAIMNKRVELTKSLFDNYEQMTTSEIIEADNTYHEELRTFMMGQLDNDSADPYYDRDYFRNHHGLDQETYALVIRNRIELTNQYLTTYNELTLEEQREVEALYHDAMHDFMYSLMNDSQFDGRNGSGSCHGSRYYDYRDGVRYDDNGDTYYNQDQNTRYRRGGMMGW